MRARTFHVVDTIISAMRPLTLKGKGFVLDYVTPHDGIRHATVDGTSVMTLDLANVVHRQIYMGCFGNAMTRWARALLRPGDTFVDVGAHAGYFTLIAGHAVGSAGRVFAVEPNPAAFDSLRAHLSASEISHAHAFNWGLSEQNGTAVLHVPDADSRRDYNATLLPRPEWRAVEVQVRTLDECLETWAVERIDLMKIDVEGSEPRVLAGGATHLTDGVVRHLMIEINGPRLLEAGSSPAALIDQLGALGFEPARLSHEKAMPVARTNLDLNPAHEWDRLFVHRAAHQSASGRERTP